MQSTKTTNVMLVIIAAGIIAIIVLLVTRQDGKRQVDVQNTIEQTQSSDKNNVNQNNSTSNNQSSNTKTYTASGYSFEVPNSVTFNGPRDIMGNGCLWNTAAIGGDGLRMGGEISIYPKTCFNLANTGCKTEVSEKNGYYIVACYDRASGTTAAEEVATKEAYQKIVATFKLK